MKLVLEECEVSTAGKNADWMRKELASHPDFKNEKNMVERLLVVKGHICVFYLSFIPSLIL